MCERVGGVDVVLSLAGGQWWCWCLSLSQAASSCHFMPVSPPVTLAFLYLTLCIAFFPHLSFFLLLSLFLFIHLFLFRHLCFSSPFFPNSPLLQPPLPTPHSHTHTHTPPHFSPPLPLSHTHSHTHAFGGPRSQVLRAFAGEQVELQAHLLAAQTRPSN